jgi:hypothetical protein
MRMSLEFAEHIKPQFSKTFVENMVRHSDVVLFGAAIPFQGGFRHVNDVCRSFWAELFARGGFEYSTF